MPAKLPQPKSKPLSNAQLNKLVQMQAGKIQQLENKIRELEAKIAGKNPTKRLDQAYSQKADDARKEKAGGKPPAPKKIKSRADGVESRPQKKPIPFLETRAK